jgi:subtilisin family serine protease
VVPSRRLTIVVAVFAGALAFAAAAAADTPTDPLVGQEWWRADVGVDTLTPPGPGMPVTLVDTGVKFTHPEFAGRPNLIALDNQEPAPIGGVHGTATASVIGAPVNGVGVVGIYPQSIIRSFDASLGDGTQLPPDEIAAGIDAAVDNGRSVINISLGGSQRSAAIDAAIRRAVAAGSLVVAAAGNSGEEGDWPTYPAEEPHVFTVGATDENDQPAPFTTSSPYVDIAAPGVDIPVASALDDSWQLEDGTSFSAPMVAGAAAWLWTARPDLDASQVAEILRESARDVGPAGYDNATGYGILDLPAALAAPTPQADSAEPNDTRATATTITTRAHPSGTTSGRVEQFEDPADVLRVWLPARRHLVVRATSGGVSVALDGVRRAGKTFSLSVWNRAKTGRAAYLVVKPSGARDVAYTLTLNVTR